MELNFFDSSEAPKPRDQVTIEALRATAYPDGWRVRVGVDVTPFQERPSLEIRLHTAAGREVAALSIIETMHRAMEFTIHIRGVNNPTGQYTLSADLYFGDERDKIQAHAETPFEIA